MCIYIYIYIYIYAYSFLYAEFVGRAGSSMRKGLQTQGGKPQTPLPQILNPKP